METQRNSVPFNPRQALVASGVGVSTLGTVMVDAEGRPGLAVLFQVERAGAPAGTTEPIALTAEMAAALIANITNIAEREGFGPYLQAQIDQSLAHIRAEESADPTLGTIIPDDGRE